MKKIKDVYCPECGHKGYELQIEHYGLASNKPTTEEPYYEHMIPYCPECEQLLYIEEIEAQNLKNKRDCMRKFLRLVSYEDLLKLPRRYSVPRKEMSIILNLEPMVRSGQAFGTSIWDGEVPTTDESERIERALKDPAYFIEQLEQHKDLFSKEKYQKIRSRAERMIKSTAKKL